MSSQFRIYFYPIFKYSFFYTGPMLKAVFATEMVILLNYIIIIIIIINNARNRGQVCLF